MDFRPLVEMWIAGRSPAAAASELGVTPMTLWRYRTGRREPSATLVKTMEARYPEWQRATNGAGEAVAAGSREVKT